MTDPDLVLATFRENRKLLQCIRSMGAAWRLVWLEGKRRAESTNAAEPLRRLTARKRDNLARLYKDGSEKQLHMIREWASLTWILEQIDAAEAAEAA